MKQYIKNGEKKYANQIVVRKEGEQIICPTEELILADGWEEYVAPITHNLLQYKAAKIREVKERVHPFIVFGVEYFTDAITLNKMMSRVISEDALKKERTTLWFGGVEHAFSILDALDLLYKIQVYYGVCFDISQNHIAEICKLTTEEEVLAYDTQAGYPEKLIVK